MRLIYILYDSINNTIFAGQIWRLLLTKIAHQPKLQIILISFERQIIQHDYFHPNIKIIQIKRLRYLGQISLFFDFLRLKTQIKPIISKPYQIIARGPFAGFIALKLFKKYQDLKLTIQARGLAAEEYRYTHKNTYRNTNFLNNFLVKLRYLQLFNLEKQVYYQQFNSNLTIECVSPALAECLNKIYQTNKLILTIAHEDLPIQIPTSQLASWRVSLRKTLNISPEKIVYCYSGSNQLWQCPTQTIQWFTQIFKQNSNAFLLILTPQVNFFKRLIQAHDLPDHSYLVLSVEHQNIYPHLAIADFGMLFREEHIINWVSRPTKALEYQSAGLPIIHNNTVAWLVKKSSQICPF